MNDAEGVPCEAYLLRPRQNIALACCESSAARSDESSTPVQIALWWQWKLQLGITV
jgi:hypothetical protein